MSSSGARESFLRDTGTPISSADEHQQQQQQHREVIGVEETIYANCVEDAEIRGDNSWGTHEVGCKTSVWVVLFGVVLHENVDDS